MATIDQTKKALEARPAAKDLRTLINEAAQELGRALPEHMRAERLVRIALTCIRQTPKLADCTPESFLGALFTAAQLGIEPISGRAYLLPFNNSKKDARGQWIKVLECQFVMGYKGLVELFYRHEKGKMLSWGVVKANDEFNYELGTEAFLKHIPAKTARGATTGFYVISDLGGPKPFTYMSFEECLEHGQKHSKTFDAATGKFYKDSPWLTNTDAMCLKTVLIQHGKVVPLSFELQQAIEQDESSREYRHGMRDMLDSPSTTNWNQDQIEAPAPPTIAAPAAVKAALRDPDDEMPHPVMSNVTGEEIPFGD